ncbi:MAG: hypothetical protein ACPG5L_02235 [Vibrio gallaecicus]|uniref:Uncharacterized protein n=2 Tax=Vibrio gallaecicus TaxID=552386 RepID=A0ABV4NC64_9VIBR|nr:hypothetical protein [Vibrio gallaecicus]
MNNTTLPILLRSICVLGIVSFVTLFLCFGAVPQVLAASLTIAVLGGFLVTYFQIQPRTLPSDELYQVLFSVNNVLLPKLVRQLDYSCQDSSNSVDQLASLFKQLSDQSNKICGLLSSQELTVEQCQRATEKVKKIHNKIILLLQFGDRTQQMQSGVLEALHLISSQVEAVLDDPSKTNTYFDEKNLLEAIDKIESRTSSHEEVRRDDVTFF